MSAPRVHILGESPLAQRIRGVLPAAVRTDDAEAAALVIDVEHPLRVDRLRAHAHLRVETWLGALLVGPLHVPGTTGCEHCAVLRRIASLGVCDAERATPARARHLPPGDARAVTSAHAFVVDVVLAAAQAFVAGPTGAAEGGARAFDPADGILAVRLDTMMVERHRLVPDPRCPQCGSLPDDVADAARLSLEPRPKAFPLSFRIRRFDLEREAIKEAFVDRRFGILNQSGTDDAGFLALGYASACGVMPVTGYGRTRTKRTAEAVAALECLERYGSLLPPGGKRTTVHKTLRELGGVAIDPRRFGAQVPDAYDHRLKDRLIPFHDDLAISWVWGHSFARAEPVLVPERLAYYGPHVPDDFVYECSNGCALGSCQEEAILFGLLEFIERDAFLLTWYRQLEVPEIDLRGEDDPEIRALLDQIAVAGFEGRVFNTTMEHGVPSVWSVAVQRTGGGLVSYVAAGAHVDGRCAVRAALYELASGLQSRLRLHAEPDVDPEQRRALAADPTRVTLLTHHVDRFFVPGVTDAELAFVLNQRRPKQPLADAFPQAPAPSLDLRVDLLEIIGRLTRRGLDVIVVDMTPADLALGLRCVKVLVTGMLSMTFGHAMRRPVGIERLETVPALLGLRAHHPGVNERPHPFG